LSASVLARAKAREPFFREMLASFEREGWLSGADVSLQPEAARVLAEAYFLISDAYKDYRLFDGHRTDRAKIAALKTAAVLAVAPFAPLDMLNTADPRTPLANAIFGVACATSVLQVDKFMRLSVDARRRFLFSINQYSRYQCLDSYLSDPFAPEDERLKLVELSRTDLFKVEMLTSLYESWR
jgi:hypothetical protein